MTVRKNLTLGERVKAFRLKRGLSQMELAVRADISLSIVAQIEQGQQDNPRLSTLRGIASALEITVAELLEG